MRLETERDVATENIATDQREVSEMTRCPEQPSQLTAVDS